MPHTALLKELVSLPYVDSINKVKAADLAKLNLSSDSIENLMIISEVNSPIFDGVDDDATVYDYLSAKYYALVALQGFNDKSLLPHFIEYIKSAAYMGTEDDWEVVSGYVMPLLPEIMEDLMISYEENKEYPNYAYFFFLLLRSLPVQPSCKELVVETALAAFSEEDKQQNSLIIQLLIKYGAVENIEEISSLMEKGYYEAKTLGDIEEVKVSMGLIKERTTEIPGDHPFWCEPSLKAREARLSRPSDGASPTSVIEYYLSLYSSAHGIPNIDFLRGLITGRAFIYTKPESNYPFHLDNELWNLKDLDKAEEKSYTRLMVVPWLSLKHGNEVNTLTGGLHEDISEKIRAEEFLIEGEIPEWVKGFQYAMKKHEMPRDFSFSPELNALLDSPTTASRRDLSELVISNYNLLKEFVEEEERKRKEARKNPASKTIVNEEVKVGRNDPCPCGSGKKYKKCCA